MSIVGTCAGPCPLAEAKERAKMQELSKYEIAPYVPVKKYRRSAAGSRIRREDVRPVHVLVTTTQYLLTLLPNDLTLPIDLYHFLDNRFRAIRSDLTLQGAESVEVLAPIARFYILAQCVLRHHETPATFAALRKLLEDQLFSVLLLVRDASMEFQRDYLLLHQDAPDFAYQLRHCARRPHSSWSETLQLCTPGSNHIRGPARNVFHRAMHFGRLERQLHEQMQILAKAYTKQDRFPVADLARFLRLPDEASARLLLEGYTIPVVPADGAEPAFFRFNEAPLPEMCDTVAMAAVLAIEFTQIVALTGNQDFASLVLTGWKPTE
ncbi:hypothetical protein ACHHYP_13010 [Achlya hypogyna]|uniref:SAC3/GANP/THP3 conserved domain-containing protein n=1 Tax=Achlya hypogyna TaxID=1202772 RepID=A0A1V9YGA5_ACHHY|nr:hypothetical protein ACHHYP_13010 [Achlya hypogyna]